MRNYVSCSRIYNFWSICLYWKSKSCLPSNYSSQFYTLSIAFRLYERLGLYCDCLDVELAWMFKFKLALNLYLLYRLFWWLILLNEVFLSSSSIKLCWLPLPFKIVLSLTCLEEVLLEFDTALLLNLLEFTNLLFIIILIYDLFLIN